MAIIQRPKGTQDILPDEARFWLYFKETARDIFGRYGYQFLETPIFERTDLFVRGIGTSTDVVSKEMYEALSGDNLSKLIAGAHVKQSSRFSLRPEGTAGVVRAVAENRLLQPGGLPVKLMYAGPMFRAENVQAGRQRQFNQVGVECLGAEDPTIDAEGIVMLMRFYAKLGIPTDAMRLLVNSMGCENCRPAYRESVRSFILANADRLCEECVGRADTNPLRAFDCKKEGCRAVMAQAPRITDHLCQECSDHYHKVLDLLKASGLRYEEDYTLVRGLDYYTRTVFEVQVAEGMGSQNAIGGGGRYDKLMEENRRPARPRVRLRAGLRALPAGAEGSWLGVQAGADVRLLHRLRGRQRSPAGVRHPADAARCGLGGRHGPSASQPEESVQAGEQAACELCGGAGSGRAGAELHQDAQHDLAFGVHYPAGQSGQGAERIPYAGSLGQ